MSQLSVKMLIQSDSQRYGGKNSWFGRLRTKFVYPSFRYTCEHRKVHRYIEEGKRGIGYYYHRYKLLRYSIKFGYQINAETKVGPGLYLGHRGTVIVNGNAVLGANVNLATGVTIGQENRGKRKGCPTIGNSVWIGSNAVIVGKITIGDNVLIAPGTYVNFDVPSNSIVVGSPVKIIPNEAATEGYIQRPYEQITVD